MALPIPRDHREPIPNNPFYSPENPTLCGAYFPVEIGSGLCLNMGGHVVFLCSTGGGGGGSGTVTSISTGTGLTGGTITTSGTIALANTAVTPGTYTRATITVDAQGRLIDAQSNPATTGGTVCSITTGNGLVGGTITTNGTISLNTACVLPPSLLSAKGTLLTANNAGVPTALNAGVVGTYLTSNPSCALGLEWITPPFGCVSSIATGTGLTGGPITTTGTVSLANTAVTPGTYTNSTITVDAQGRITSASNGTVTLGTVTCVASGNGLTGGPITSFGTLALNTACVIQPTLVTARGDIITASAAGTPAALSVGTNGQYLVACSTEPTGLKWVNTTVGSVSSVATGTGLTGGPITSTGTICLADTAVTPGSYTYTSITVDQQGRLTAASSGATPVLPSCFLTKGSLLVGTGAGSFTSLPVGASNGRYLAVNSSCASGVEWVSSTALSLCGYTCGATLFNTAFGACSGNAITTGTGGTFLGYGAGSAVTSGAGNVLIGCTAGDAITTGSNNTIVGDIPGTTALSDNLILGAGSTIKIQVNENGALGVGSTPSYGSSGQILTSCGTGSAPVWKSSASLPANFGQFSSDVIQNNLDTVNGNAVTYNTTAFSQNVSVVDGSKVTFASAGTYNIQVSLQVSKTDAGSDIFLFWFKKNGADIPSSASSITLNGNNDAQLATVNILESFTVGQYVEVWWASPDTNIQLLSGGIAPAPIIPSVILTAVPVGA